MNRLVVFDCDGTLVDSQHSICAAMGRAFEDMGLAPPDRLAILSVVGLSLPVAMARLLPDAESDLHAALTDRYKLAFQSLRRAEGVQEPFYRGIADLIEALDGAGWLLGVATGKSDRGLRLCLAHHGVLDRFVTLQTADRHPSKPHPSMLLTAMAEAGAALVQARQMQQADPAQAVQYAQRANDLAAQAIQYAQNDVGAFGSGAGGMFGGSGGSGSGGNVMGAILGGIVINSLLGGGGRSSGGGGFGGGGFGGGFGGGSRGGGMSPGSFGGGGTRSRRGGGRF